VSEEPSPQLLAPGHELSVSANTVSDHIAGILDKLHLDNRIQAAVQAVRNGIA
jgi:DNA-binding NarL/FixJ family response regulator